MNSPITKLPSGRFVELAEDWCCDECGEAIQATLQAYVFEHGPQKGQCHCIRCAVNPNYDGASQRLDRWRSSAAFSPAYEVHKPSAIVPPGSVQDSREKWPEGQSNYDPMAGLRRKP